MMKTFARAALGLLSLAVMFMFSSCDLFSDPDLLISPPKASGELEGVEDALNEAIDGSFGYVYPASGSSRVPFFTEDIDGDGVDEAIVLYKLTESGEMHLNCLHKVLRKWKSSADIKLAGTGIDRVDFVDLCGDKTKEIMVGCSLYSSSDNALYVYDVTGTELKQLTNEPYAGYLVCNMMEYKKPQILTVTLGDQTVNNEDDGDIKQTGKPAVTSLISLDSGAADVTVIGSFTMSGNATSIAGMSEGKTADGERAVYIDYYLGATSMSTEIITVDKTGTIIGMFGKNTDTLRDTPLSCRDINGDGIIEIPDVSLVPGYDAESDNALYYSYWKQYSSTGFKTVSSGFYNSFDKYFISLPRKHMAKISIGIDRIKNTASFFEYSKQGNPSKQIFSICVFSSSSFKTGGDGYVKLMSAGERIIAVKLNQALAAKYGIDEEYLKNNINHF